MGEAERYCGGGKGNVGSCAVEDQAGGESIASGEVAAADAGAE